MLRQVDEIGREPERALRRHIAEGLEVLRVRVESHAENGVHGLAARGQTVEEGLHGSGAWCRAGVV